MAIPPSGQDERWEERSRSANRVLKEFAARAGVTWREDGGK